MKTVSAYMKEAAEHIDIDNVIRANALYRKQLAIPSIQSELDPREKIANMGKDNFAVEERANMSKISQDSQLGSS